MVRCSAVQCSVLTNGFDRCVCARVFALMRIYGRNMVSLFFSILFAHSFSIRCAASLHVGREAEWTCSFEGCKVTWGMRLFRAGWARRYSTLPAVSANIGEMWLSCHSWTQCFWILYVRYDTTRWRAGTVSHQPESAIFQRLNKTNKHPFSNDSLISLLLRLIYSSFLRIDSWATPVMWTQLFGRFAWFPTSPSCCSRSCV